MLTQKTNQQFSKKHENENSAPVSAVFCYSGSQACNRSASPWAADTTSLPGGDRMRGVETQPQLQMGRAVQNSDALF